MDELPPDSTRIFSFLRTLAKGEKQSAEETHELVELIRNMASENIISRLEAKFDSQSEKIDTLKTLYTAMIWVVGIVGTSITIAIALSG